MTNKNNKPIRRHDDFLIFGSPMIGENEKREVLDCLETGWLGSGPKVAQFESEFCDYKHAKYAMAVNSCTAALHLSMLTAGIKSGDEVITTSLTFCSTVNAIIHAGARPVLVDVNPQTFNMDPDQIEDKISRRTRAILPVHFAGRPCDMDTICMIADKHGLIIIEDCAHSIETTYKNKHVGTFGKFGCFSFYVTKNLSTGEGGMVLTDDEACANRIKMLALHGMTKDAWHRFGDEGYKHYHVVECGYKYNMMDIQAAIGIHQLHQIEDNWKRRKTIWTTYQKEFQNLPLTLPMPHDKDIRHAYHLYIVLIDPERTGITRDEFLIAINSENIGVGVHYQSIPTHPYYRKHFGWKPEDYPNSFRIGQQTVSLPLSPKLTNRDVSDVISAVRKVLGIHYKHSFIN